jgi:DNA-binding CsgD family transcriptional regulator
MVARGQPYDQFVHDGAGLMRPLGSDKAAAGDLVEELRQLAQVRMSQVKALNHAVTQVRQEILFQSLQSVVESLPLVLDVDVATIRLKDEREKLHLVAAAGCAASDVRARALQPIDLKVVRTLATSDVVRQNPETFGYRSAELRWLGPADSTIGALLVASRTGRRPTPHQLSYLERLSGELTARLMPIDRRETVLARCASQLARSAEVVGPAESLLDVGALRTRERTILQLYAEGLTTHQIATLLVISPHTVRTHVKSALRTLELHSRREAETLVLASTLLQLL